MRNVIIALALAISFSIASAETMNFNVNGKQDKEAVTFTSEATLETIEGKTSEIRGFVAVDPTDVTIGAQAKFAVALASLKTGIDMRDKHMRENHLETDKFPEAVFVLHKVTSQNGGDLTDGQSKHLTLDGDFTIHGVTQSITMEATVTFMAESKTTEPKIPGDILHIVAQFEVTLADYEIKRPKFLFLKLSETQVVDIDIFASTGLPEVTFIE
ncbi:MAG: YceI family protein [candidate division Zixibacteria bacterium]|nr:YceI family protein [candidate division Zixibacteria bacterium]